MTGPVPPHTLDPSIVCGLLSERGEQARSADHDRPWRRDHAMWRAVEQSLTDAAAGVRPRDSRATPPAWLPGLIRQRIPDLATRTASGSAFQTIRTLERLGLVELPVDDDYVLAAVAGIGDRWTATRAQAVRQDPDLLDRVVWRMFEVEGGGEVSLANVDKYSAPAAGWQAAFVELAGDGTLDRARVLSSCLSALNRDFSAYRAGWYSRLYDALSPSLEELDRHQPLLRPLLRSSITATVTFAVNKLKRLSRTGRLDDVATVAALRPAVLGSAKTTALNALRVVSEAVARTPAAAADAVQTAATGLEHPHADVQLAAAGLLGELGAGGEIARAAEHLEPSVQHDLGLTAEQPLAAGRQPAPTCGPVPPSPLPGPADDRDVLDRTAALLENADDPIEVELVLAGLAALTEPAALRPLVKRAASVLQRGPRDGVVPGWLRGQLARLVLIAHGQTPAPLPAAGHQMAFLVERLDEVAAVLGGGRAPRRLLATPDQPQGWLTPVTLVARLAETDAPPLRYDLLAALLRLHPNGRDTALRALQRSAAPDGATVAAVRYALGGAPPSGSRPMLPRRSPVGSDPAVWVAASRARAPEARDPWLQGQDITGAGRSAAVHADVTFTENPYRWHDHRGEHAASYWTWQLDIAEAPAAAATDEPTAARPGSEDVRFRESREDFVTWSALIYPHDAEVFLVDAIHPVLSAATADEVQHDAVRVLRALSGHPGRLGPLGLATLAAGLTASKADQRTHAVDAVHALHAAGRLPPEELAEGMRRLVGPATLTRWAATLRDLASADETSAELVVAALTATLPTIPPRTRGLHALLELLREELLRLGAPTPAPLRPWLQRFSGASRAAKAARALHASA